MAVLEEGGVGPSELVTSAGIRRAAGGCADPSEGCRALSRKMRGQRAWCQCLGGLRITLTQHKLWFVVNDIGKPLSVSSRQCLDPNHTRNH